MDHGSDYDRVIAHLKRAIASGDSHQDRVWVTEDLTELLELGTHWQRVLASDPTRRGTWWNLALMNWVGLDTGRRLPYVFNALGLRLS